jgi:hypothetical protein
LKIGKYPAMNTLEILNQDKISTAFIKANGFLVEKYKLDIERAICKNKKLEELWTIEFDAILKFNNELKVYDKIEFKDSEMLTIFLLKWG